MKLNRLIKKGIIDTNYYLIAQIGSKFLGFLVVPFLVRLLSVEEFAHYDIFLMVASLITLIAGLGIDSGVAILIADYKGDIGIVRYLFSFSLFVSLFVVLLFWAISHFVFPLIDQVKPILIYINYLFLYILFNLTSYQVFNFIRWLGKAGLASVIGFVSYAFGITLGFCFIYFKSQPSLIDYLQGLVIGNLIGAIASLLISLRYITVKWNSRYNVYIKELFEVSLPYIPNYLSNYFMMMFDRLIVISMLGSHSLGVYALASRFAQIPNFAINVLNRGFQPVMYLNYKNEEGQVLIRRIYNYCHYALIPILIFIYLASKSIILIFGGEKYIAAVPLVPLITMSTLLYGIMGLNGLGYTIKRKTYFISIISIGAVLLNFLLNYFLGLHFGLFGIALGSLSIACLVSFIYTYFSERFYSFKLNLKITFGIYLFLLVFAIMSIYVK